MIRLEMHYVNPGAAPIEVRGDVDVHLAAGLPLP
jgi:hypothetical protein